MKFINTYINLKVLNNCVKIIIPLIICRLKIHVQFVLPFYVYKIDDKLPNYV